MNTPIFFSIKTKDNIKISINNSSLILSDEKTTHKISINQIKKVKLVKAKNKSYSLKMSLFFVFSLVYLLYNFSWVTFTIIVTIHLASFLLSRQFDYYLIIQSNEFFKKIKINNTEKDNIKSLVIEFHELTNLKNE